MMFPTLPFLLLALAGTFAGVKTFTTATPDPAVHGNPRLRRLQSAVGQVTSLRLIAAGTISGWPIATHNPIVHGAVVDLSTLTQSNLSVEAVTTGIVGSVRFTHQGSNGTFLRIENSARWALCGNTGDNFGTCNALVVGNHTVTATPYAGTAATGLVGTAVSVSFTIVRGPVVTPIAAPLMTPAAAPLMTPVVAPLMTPVAAPLMTPVAAPLVTPVAAPLMTPVAVTPVALPPTLTNTCAIPKVSQSQKGTKMPS